MSISHLISYFFGGAFLMNAVPHVVSGVMGKPFQTPFARPRGEGHSSSTTNVVWGFFNLFIAYLLLVHIGGFALDDVEDAAAASVGAFLLAVMMAWHFGRFNGGNTPSRP